MNDEKIYGELVEIKKEITAVHKEIARTNLELAKQSVDLSHHIRRTDLAEKRIEMLQKALFIALGALLAAELVVKYVV